MKWSIISKVSFGFGVALGIVVVIDWVSYKSLTAFTGHVDSMSRIYRIDDTLVHVLRQLQDAETGQRGFLITGQESYLRPYEEALLTLDDDIDRMRAMVLAVGHPDLVSRVGALNPLVSEKLAELRRTIEVRRREGFDAAQLLVRSDVPAQPEMESERFPLVSIPPFGRGFSRHGGLSIRCGFGKSAKAGFRARLHRLDEPTRLSLGRVASPQWGTRPTVWTMREGTVVYAEDASGVGS